MALEKNSIVTITKLRELILNSLASFFKERVDYTFLDFDQKDNKIWLFDEEAENLENKNAYPRIVLFRNGSVYREMSGLNDSHEGHEFWNESFTRADINNHNFTLRVIAQGMGPTENLAYIVSVFIRYFSKELAVYDEDRRTFDIRHKGMSNCQRQGEVTENKPLFRCDINFFIDDNEIIRFNVKTDSKKFNNFDVQLNLPTITCSE